MDAFIRRSLRFVARYTGDFNHGEALWRCLEVSSDALDVLVELDLHWDGTHLGVHNAWEGRRDCFQVVAVCVLYLFRWVSYSETRWIKGGRSGRLWLRSLLGGVEGVFERAKVRTFLVVASPCNYPMESLLLELLQDDRLLMRVGELKQVLLDEISYLDKLPDYFWRRAAACIEIGFDYRDLRHLTLRGAHIGLAYAHMEIFVRIGQGPFTLTQGHIESNLDELATWATPSSSHTVRKIQACLADGYPTAKLVRALQLLKEVPFSTNAVEEGHAAEACLIKFHETHGERRLRSRCMVTQCGLLSRPSKQDKAVDKLERELEDAIRNRSQLVGFNCSRRR